MAHGHRGRKPPNATPVAVVADVVRLARTRCEGANHTHLSELLHEGRILAAQEHHPVQHLSATATGVPPLFPEPPAKTAQVLRL